MKRRKIWVLNLNFAFVCRGHHIEHVVVCRHLLPSEEIVVGNGDGPDVDEPPAKRPSRRLVIKWHDSRDKWLHKLMETASKDCDPVWLDAEDPLFMLYTR